MAQPLILDEDPDSAFVQKRASLIQSANRPLRNGDTIACTRTWKYETYIVEVGDLGEIINETPDEEGEVVVRWKAQNKQGYIKPSALEHFQDPATSPRPAATQQRSSAPPPQQAGHALPSELMGGYSSKAKNMGVGYGHYTAAPAKGKAQMSLAEKAALRQQKRLQEQNSFEDDLPDLFPDDGPPAGTTAHTSNPDTQTVPISAPMANMSFNNAGAGASSPMESNPDAADESRPITVTFKPGRIGIRYMGNIITKVTAETQAAELGVQFGWQILEVNSNALPTNMNQQNAQKCVDVFLAQQKAEKKPYTITFRPTETRILVVGAGCDIVNGSYVEFGVHHGKPRYRKAGNVGPNTIYIWWDKHSYWNMVNQEDFVKYKQNGGSKKSCYYGIQSDESVPPTEGWMRSHLGKNPLPVLVTSDGR